VTERTYPNISAQTKSNEQVSMEKNHKCIEMHE